MTPLAGTAVSDDVILALCSAAVAPVLALYSLYIIWDCNREKP